MLRIPVPAIEWLSLRFGGDIRRLPGCQEATLVRETRVRGRLGFVGTLQPTICDVLCDLLVLWQSPRCSELL